MLAKREKKMPKCCIIKWILCSLPAHDEEWGRPRMMIRHFWVISCMGDLSGRSDLETVLNKRQAFPRNSFHGYQIQRVAEMTDSELEILLDNPAIIRNRAKISRHGPMSAFLKKSRKNLDRLMPTLVFCRWGKPSSMMFQITDRLQKTALSGEAPRTSKKREFIYRSVAVLSYSMSSRPGQWSWECLWMEKRWLVNIGN